MLLLEGLSGKPDLPVTDQRALQEALKIHFMHSSGQAKVASVGGQKEMPPEQKIAAATQFILSLPPHQREPFFAQVAEYANRMGVGVDRLAEEDPSPH